MLKVNIYSRYPLPLQNGMQCKIIQGFGNTICKRLEEKLKEHRLKQSNSLEIPVSPVLLPQGQVPRASPTKSNSPSSSKSQEDRDLELALELSQQEFVPRAFPKKSNSLSSQEDKDLEFALELSQQEASSLPHRIGQNFRGHGFVHGFVNFEKGGPIPIHVGSYIVNPCNFLPSRIQNMKINVKSMSEYL